GWPVGLLAAWSREQDVRVCLPAWRVLRNLTLAERLLESPPPSDAPGDSSAERYTQCWPRDWLPADLLPLRARLLSVDYDSAWSEWRPRCPARRGRALAERADELRRQLIAAGLGDRPIVWVTHSMGGLLVKQLLATALLRLREACCSLSRSRRTGVGRLVLADADHLDVCKPRSRQSQVYQMVVEFVRDNC
ncbi:protein SERAC1-like, partial [Pollicipes pollicipes]|uniref:protein SERAC1-like n=1 Tax=Pollicipes pollicipes TaxID=41117 RepID=UPI00188568FC